MVFSSISFLIFFLPVVLIVYFLIPSRKRTARNYVLLLFSLVFYSIGGPSFLILLLVSVIINYICGFYAAPERSLLTRKLAVVFAAVLGLGLIGWFKYSGFLAETINRFGAGIPVPDVTLPLGISFFTFQGLSYVIDVYRGHAKTQRNPLNIALYISLFPALIAGPIVRYTAIESDISSRKERLEDFSAGVVRFSFGLAKKMLLANALGEIADKVFGGAPGSLSVLTAWVGALAFTGQLYFDFSAYSDMAIGLCRMFGFRIPENFNYPYIAKSVTDFWRRWHISLSTWFRDYLYIPLGGSRAGTIKHVRNFVIVWLLTGLWHGAAWTFVLWGALTCLTLLCERFFRGRLPSGRTPSPIKHIYTMALVTILWVFFRSETALSAVAYVGAMFGANGMAADGQGVYYILQYWPELVIAIVASIPVKQYIEGFIEKKTGALAGLVSVWAPRALALVLLAVSYLKLVTGAFSPFIYFRF